MFGLGNAVRFVAMRFAAQTVLAGLGSLQFVFIPLASRTLLGIRAQTATLVGVAVVLLGERARACAGRWTACACSLAVLAERALSTNQACPPLHRQRPHRGIWPR